MLGKIKQYIPNIFKTVYFNFKFLPFGEAIYLPILVDRRTAIIKKSTGKITIEDKSAYHKIYIGFPCLKDTDKKNERTVICINGHLCFQGQAFVANGVKLQIEKEGTLILGSNFNSTGKAEIICAKKIEFKKECTISWDVLIMDTDSHSIFDSHCVLTNPNKEILIGEGCWIGCRTTILKGTSIADHVVVASCANVTKSISTSNVIVGGNPAKIMKENVQWALQPPEEYRYYENII